MAKIKIQGTDAESFLQMACANNLAVSPGKTVYTGILNDRGGFESDVTITRLAQDDYFLITATATGVHDLDLLRRRIPTTFKSWSWFHPGPLCLCRLG